MRKLFEEMFASVRAAVIDGDGEDFCAGPDLSELNQRDAAQAHFQQLLNDLANVATGSANRIARLHLMAKSASIDKGEITDKGSINQRAVLKQWDVLAHALHDGSLPYILQPQPRTKPPPNN